MTKPERRSRRTWPGPMSTAGVGEGHSHEWPEALPRRIRLLTRALLVFGVCLAVLTFLFVSLIQTRSAERSSENERTNQRINDAICDLLDQLPEGGLLERPRSKYGCGPGIPLAQLTPEERGQLSNRTASSSPVPSAQSAAPSPAAPPFGSGAVLNPPRATTPPAPPRPTLPPRPTVTPEPDPLVDLSPITDPLCQALGVCT